MLFPDAAAQGKAVQVGEHHIQDGQIRGRGVHGRQGVCGVVEFVDGEALALEVDLHQIGDGGFVVHHKDALGHGGAPPPGKYVGQMGVL